MGTLVYWKKKKISGQFANVKQSRIDADTDDDECSGRAYSPVIPKKGNKIILENREVMLRKITNILKKSIGSPSAILHEDLI